MGKRKQRRMDGRPRLSVVECFYREVDTVIGTIHTQAQ